MHTYILLHTLHLVYIKHNQNIVETGKNVRLILNCNLNVANWISGTISDRNVLLYVENQCLAVI